MKIVKVGNINQCSIDFENADNGTLAIASIIHRNESLVKNLNIKVIRNLLEEGLDDSLYVSLLFGSYAAGTNKKGSDIDLLFLIESEDNVEKFKRKVEGILSTLDYETHIVVSTLKWFYKMIGEKGTVGREVFKCSIILNGPEAYYSLVRKYDKERGY